MLKQINSLEEFNKATQEGITVVDFFATWCRPCQVMMPHVEQAAQELLSVKFIKVDVDESPDIASLYGVMGLPTVIQFRDGEVFDQFSGQRPLDFFLSWVE